LALAFRTGPLFGHLHNSPIPPADLDENAPVSKGRMVRKLRISILWCSLTFSMKVIQSASQNRETVSPMHTRCSCKWKHRATSVTRAREGDQGQPRRGFSRSRLDR